MPCAVLGSFRTTSTTGVVVADAHPFPLLLPRSLLRCGPKVRAEEVVVAGAELAFRCGNHHTPTNTAIFRSKLAHHQ